MDYRGAAASPLLLLLLLLLPPVSHCTNCRSHLSRNTIFKKTHYISHLLHAQPVPPQVNIMVISSRDLLLDPRQAGNLVRASYLLRFSNAPFPFPFFHFPS